LRVILGGAFAFAVLSCASSTVPTVFSMDEGPPAAAQTGTGGAQTGAVASNGGAQTGAVASSGGASTGAVASNGGAQTGAVASSGGTSQLPPMGSSTRPPASGNGGNHSGPSEGTTGGANDVAGCDATASCDNTGSPGGDVIDAGGTPPLPTDSVFNDAPPFAAHTGPRTHNAGKDCMSCHTTGSTEAPRFSFGGTLYDPMGNAVVGAEIRLVDANGKATSVYTSSTGTFYSQGTGFVVPARIGARNAMYESDMLPSLQTASDGACTGCHCTGAACMAVPVHLP
jgi:hypothetical protein